jgi:hypothetical protein
MQRTLKLLALLSFLSHTSEGREHPLVYASIGLNLGNVYGIQLSGAAIVRVRHEVSIGYLAGLRNVRSMPADFECSCNHGVGKDFVGGGILSYGYVMYPGRWAGYTRVVLRGGMFLGEQGVKDNFRPATNPGPRDANYEFDENHGYSMAFVLRPTVDLALGRYAGISVGPYGFFNKEFIGGGVSISALLGHIGYMDVMKLRRERKQAASRIRRVSPADANLDR